MSVLKIRDENDQWADILTIKGETGDAAGFGTVSATVDAGNGSPSVDVTASGEDTAKNFAFAFHNLKYDDTALASRVTAAEGDIDDLEADVATCLSKVGTPLVASTVAGMTDHTKIYVYTGSETGYTNGNWYYWNGSAWASGGVYNSTALSTDTTLLVSGAAADSATVGTEITNLKDDLTSITNGAEKTYQYGYIDCARATIPITDVTSSLYYKYLVDSCSEGDIYVINGVGSSGAKPWTFVDSNGKRLTFYQSDGTWACDNQIVIAPANAAYLISNYHINSSTHPFAYKYNGDVFGDSLKAEHTYAKAIPSSSDLNDYTQSGNYKVLNIATAQTITNIPESSSGRLTVFTLVGGATVHQWFISANNKWYIRELISGAWSSWKQLASMNDVSTRLPMNYEYASVVAENDDFDNYTTPGSYRVSTSAIAATISHIPEKVSGRLTVLTLNSSLAVHQLYIAANNKWFVRELISGNWSTWRQFVDIEQLENNATAGVAAKGAYNAIHAIIKESPYDIAFANAFTPITLRNYIESTQNVHPKVLYFANGFGGHKYWMAYTPYPYSNDLYENPCIAYSDDGISWTNIEDNPLDDPQGNGYNSDTHLVYREDIATLECWFRYVGPASQSPREETIYRMTTTDGVTWSGKEVVYSNTSGQYAKLLSPAVIVKDNKYCIWVVNGDEGIDIDYYEAPISDVTNWTKVRTIALNYTDDGVSVNPWHIDAIYDGTQYIILVMCRNSTSLSTAKCSLFVTTSNDNITYSTPVKVVAGANNWDKYMYRSSIVKVGDVYRIYYSASSGGTTTIYNNAVWGIGITESSQFDSGYIGMFE